ncbi:hypothetical protein [Pseudomonas syringae]|uniref:hypothetical protein n=1 Tax=Pseudomonas syringae TaxID=317 RepID=UPI000E310435|nr:hypothetical protein [Pseudomonas syringae]
MVEPVRKIIVLRTYDEEYEFDTANKLRQFVGSEVDAWRWIFELPVPFAMQEYTHEFISQPLRKAERAFDAEGETVYYVDLKTYVSSVGELGTLALEIKKEHGHITGIMFLLVAHPELAGKLNQYSSLEAFFTNGSFYYERSLALHLFFETINIKKLTTKKRHHEREQEILKFKHAHETAIEDATSQLKRAITQIMILRSDQNKDTKATLRKNKRRVQLYRTLLDKTAKSGHESLKQSQAALQDARADLITAQDTYHAQVDLKASVQYWTEEMNRHGRTALRWLSAVVVTTAMTFLAPVFYYHLGGITGLSLARTERTVSNMVSTPLKSQKIDSLDSPIQGETADVEPRVPQELTLSPLAAHIADLTGAALLIALLSIFIRLSLRQFNTHSYLRHESAERLVMTKTYLALSNEGKLSTDTDRKLVLEALFRATQSNGVPETAISTPIELIIKAVTDSKPDRN